jgi:hypothetical protein
MSDTTKLKAARKFTLQLNFTIDIDGSNIQFDPTYWSTLPEDRYIQEHLGHERRLFDGLIAQKEVLRAYLNYLILGELECMEWRDWRDIFGLDDSKESEGILASIIEKLPEEDRTWFAEVIEEGIFTENTEAFQKAFSVSWDKTLLVEKAEGEAAE